MNLIRVDVKYSAYDCIFVFTLQTINIHGEKADKLVHILRRGNSNSFRIKEEIKFLQITIRIFYEIEIRNLMIA